jgi:hypothetical protein
VTSALRPLARVGRLGLAALLLSAVAGPLAGQPLAASSPAGALRPIVLPPVIPTVFGGDVRTLHRPELSRGSSRPELEQPDVALPPPIAGSQEIQTAAPLTSAPAPSITFPGLDHAGWGAGYPPDTNGDVGPAHYIQLVNVSVGIFRKTDGFRLAAFTFDTLFSSASTGTPCDNNNQGDPVVLYDPQANRWIISDLAWANFTSGAMYQCFAVSRTGDPVSGGWYFYAVQTDPGGHLGDYPKLGVWPDGIYMSANMYSTTGSMSFQHVKVWAFNRSDLESGAPLHGVSFNLPTKIGPTYVFSLLPSNLRGAAPPAGRPNLFASIYGSYQARIWKFHADWTAPASSTFTGPSNVTIAAFSVGPARVPEPSPGNALDTLTYRLMMQNQYRNLAGQESLWLAHTVGNGSGVASVRWYQINVTGGTVVTAKPVQQGTFNPNALHRFMPSLAVDGQGDMAIGYTASSTTFYPSIRYAGRLVGDAPNTLGQGETTLWAGAGAQTNSCGGAACTRWGDYSAMTVDPVDDCTFWYTNEFYAVNGGNWQTRIGAFRYPSCVDEAPPAIVAPQPRLYFPTRMGTGTSIPVRIKWSATDLSGVASYQLQHQTNGGAWSNVTLASATATSVVQSLTFGTSSRYRLMATDGVGNTSDWVYGPTFTPTISQESSGAITYTGSWTTAASTSASGGSLRYTTQAGASATFSFVGSSVAWIAFRGPDRGSATVYIDGVLKTTINLNAATNSSRRVAYAFTWATNGSHAIRVVAVGTAGHPRIDVDGFVKLALQ